LPETPEKPEEAPSPTTGPNRPPEEMTPAERLDTWLRALVCLCTALFVGGLAFMCGWNSHELGTRALFFSIGTAITATLSYMGLVILMSLKTQE
jgi:hypothetical protein